MNLRSRFLLLALAAVLSLSMIAAGCGGDDDEGGGESSEDAVALLERAFDKATNQSSQVELSLEADLQGAENLDGPIKMDLSGPVIYEGPKALPQLDWDISVEGAGQSIDAGVVATADNAYIEFQNQAYELGTDLFGQVKESYEAGAAEQPDDPGAAIKQLGLDPSTWLADPQVEDGDDIGGDATQVVTGDLDVRAATEDVVGALESPALQRQLEATGQTVPKVPELSDKQLSQVEDAVKEASFEVNVDEQDNVRRMALTLEFEVPEDQRQNADFDGGTISVDYALPEIGIDQQIEAPANARPLSELLGGFGLGGLESLPDQ